MNALACENPAYIIGTDPTHPAGAAHLTGLHFVGVPVVVVQGLEPGTVVELHMPGDMSVGHLLGVWRDPPSLLLVSSVEDAKKLGARGSE